MVVSAVATARAVRGHNVGKLQGLQKFNLNFQYTRPLDAKDFAHVRFLTNRKFDSRTSMLSLWDPPSTLYSNSSAGVVEQQ